MFQFIFNVTCSIFFSIWMILLTIITGKLSKISYYHFDDQSEDNNFFNICSDRFIKTNLSRNVSNECKEKIIQDFLVDLSRNEKFTSVASPIDFPIFNGKEIIGTQGYYPVLKDCLKDHINKYK